MSIKSTIQLQAPKIHLNKNDNNNSQETIKKSINSKLKLPTKIAKPTQQSSIPQLSSINKTQSNTSTNNVNIQSQQSIETTDNSTSHNNNNNNNVNINQNKSSTLLKQQQQQNRSSIPSILNSNSNKKLSLKQPSIKYNRIESASCTDNQMHKSIENTSSGVSTSSSITSMTTQVSCKDSLLLETTNTNNSAYNIEDFNNKNKIETSTNSLSLQTTVNQKQFEQFDTLFTTTTNSDSSHTNSNDFLPTNNHINNNVNDDIFNLNLNSLKRELSQDLIDNEVLPEVAEFLIVDQLNFSLINNNNNNYNKKVKTTSDENIDNMITDAMVTTTTITIDDSRKVDSCETNQPVKSIIAKLNSEIKEGESNMNTLNSSVSSLSELSQLSAQLNDETKEGLNIKTVTTNEETTTIDLQKQETINNNLVEEFIKDDKKYDDDANSVFSSSTNLSYNSDEEFKKDNNKRKFSASNITSQKSSLLLNKKLNELKKQEATHHHSIDTLTTSTPTTNKTRKTSTSSSITSYKTNNSLGSSVTLAQQSASSASSSAKQLLLLQNKENNERISTTFNKILNKKSRDGLVAVSSNTSIMSELSNYSKSSLPIRNTIAQAKQPQQPKTQLGSIKLTNKTTTAATSSIKQKPSSAVTDRKKSDGILTNSTLNQKPKLSAPTLNLPSTPLQSTKKQNLLTNTSTNNKKPAVDDSCKLNKQIKRLEELCETRTKELNLLRLKLKDTLTAFDGITCAYQYVTNTLNGFATPMLKMQLKITKAKYDEQIERLNKTIDDKEKKLVEIEKSLNEALCKLSDKEKEYDGKIIKINEKHLNEINECQVELNEQNQMVESLNNELNEKHQLIIELEKKVTEYEETLNKNKEERLQESLDRQVLLEKEIESLKAAIEIKNIDLFDLRCKNNDLTTKNDELTKLIPELQRQKCRIENLEEMYMNKSDEAKRLAEQYEILKSTIDESRRENKRISMRMEELQFKLKSTATTKSCKLNYEDSINDNEANSVFDDETTPSQSSESNSSEVRLRSKSFYNNQISYYINHCNSCTCPTVSTKNIHANNQHQRRSYNPQQFRPVSESFDFNLTDNQVALSRSMCYDMPLTKSVPSLENTSLNDTFTHDKTTINEETNSLN